MLFCVLIVFVFFFFFQAEDGIRVLVRSRGLGDVYKRQVSPVDPAVGIIVIQVEQLLIEGGGIFSVHGCRLYLSLIHI